MVRLLFSFLAIVTISFQISAQTITAEHIEKVAGSWSGTLTYTDDTDDVSKYRLSATMEASWNGKKLVYNIVYTDPMGEIINIKQTVKLSENEHELIMNGTWSIVDFKSKGENWSVGLEKAGRDNNKPSIIQQDIDFKPNEITIIKHVKYDGTEEFFQRNKYEFTRNSE